MGSVYGPNIVTDGLVFLMDAGNAQSYPGSGTTVYDLVGNNNGTLTGDAVYSSADGGVIDIIDSGDYINVLNSTSLPANLQTWAIWVNFDTLPASNSYDSVWLKSANWNSTGGVGLQFIYNYLTWSWGNNWGGTCSVAQSTLSTGVWYYIVGTSPGDTSTNGCKFYINGDLKDTGTAAVVPSNGYPLLIGSGHGDSMNGQIARFEIWSGELTAAQILQNYNAHKSRFGL